VRLKQNAMNDAGFIARDTLLLIDQLAASMDGLGQGQPFIRRRAGDGHVDGAARRLVRVVPERRLYEWGHMGKASSVAVLLLLMSESPRSDSLTMPERQRLIAHLDMTERWLIDEVARLSPAQLSFRPAPGAWSIMQVVDHLVVVGPIYWQDLQKAIQGPPSTAAASGTDADILWYGIDRTNRERAIPSEVPKENLRDLSQGLDAIRKQRAQLRQYIKTTSDDLRSRIVERQQSDAYQWALLISTHEQRHILQIREIKADPRFPVR
jgi:hypothetical protein